MWRDFTAFLLFLHERCSGVNTRKTTEKKSRTIHMETIKAPSFNRRTISGDVRWASQDIEWKSRKSDHVRNHERQKRNSIDRLTILMNHHFVQRRFQYLWKILCSYGEASTTPRFIYRSYCWSVVWFSEGAIWGRKIYSKSWIMEEVYIQSNCRRYLK